MNDVSFSLESGKITGFIGRNGATIPDVDKVARDKLGLKGGDRLIMGSDEHSVALIPAEYFESKMRELMEMISG